MQYLLSILPFALSALAVAPEASPVPAIPAPGSPPAGCSPDYAEGFTILNTMLPGSSRKRTPPSEGPASGLSLTLSGGILRDGDGRFGYIASNYQFQFDNPIQAGAIYTENWSACSNLTLALGGSTTFYQCISGNFYNLYSQPVRSGCIPIEFAIINSGGSVSSVPVSSYAASTSSVAVYSSATPVAVTSTSAAASTPAPVSTPASTAPPTTVAPITSAAPAATSAATTASYTGAANPLAIEGSFFAVAAGAAVLAAF